MDDTASIGKKTVRDIDVAGRRLLLRADLNVPLDGGRVADDSRILASLPTIRFLVEHGARVAICSHLGRPKGVPGPALSLRPISETLAELLGAAVTFVDDCVGPEAESAVARLPGGGVALLENLRFHAGEEANDPDFARQLASLADVYVNDAFGAAHRSHASTEGVAHLLPAVAGLLLEREVQYLEKLVADPPRPCMAIVGGAKVSTKIAAIEHLLGTIDALILGGGMANTFLKARGIEIGRSLVEADLVETAGRIIEQAQEARKRVLLPVDVVIAPELSDSAEAETVPVDAVPPDGMILDIGPRSVREYAAALRGAASVIWNGPMGVFEIPQFSRGSFALAEAVASLDAVTVVGGGETAALVARAGLTDRFTHVSTGGGASLEMLEGKTLPGVAALDDAG